jgi:hypothetical protein
MSNTKTTETRDENVQAFASLSIYNTNKLFSNPGDCLEIHSQNTDNIMDMVLDFPCLNNSSLNNNNFNVALNTDIFETHENNESLLKKKTNRPTTKTNNKKEQAKLEISPFSTNVIDEDSSQDGKIPRPDNLLKEVKRDALKKTTFFDLKKNPGWIQPFINMANNNINHFIFTGNLNVEQAVEVSGKEKSEKLIKLLHKHYLTEMSEEERQKILKRYEEHDYNINDVESIGKLLI